MERFKEAVSDIFWYFLSVLIALARLIFLTLAMFTSALHITLFTKTELCNVELRGQPLLCDRRKLKDQISFVDKVMIENPELLDYADEQMRQNGELPPDDDEGDHDI